MRFAELGLLRYGHFENRTIVLPRGSCDLHLIHGSNEAGKSTSRAAVLDLLFDFPHRSAYGFQFDQSLLLVGAVLEADGRRLPLRRRKGRKDTLLDEAGQTLDERVLAALLHGHGRDSFARMFALNHEELRRGGREVLSGADDVGQALFAAGAGLARLRSVQSALEQEVEQIHKATGRRSANRSLDAAWMALDAARSALQAHLTPARSWLRARDRRDEADQAVAALRARRDAAEVERTRLERLRRIAAPAAELLGLRARLEGLAGIPDLPGNAGRILQQCTEMERDAQAAAERTARERTALEERAAVIVPAPALLAEQDTIEQLKHRVAVVEKALLDLPNRRAEVAQLDGQIAADAAELGWADTASGRLRLPTRITVGALRDLLERRTQLLATRQETQRAAEAAGDAVTRLAAAAEALPAAEDASALAEALTSAQRLGDVVAERKRRADAASVQEGLASRALVALSPWQGTEADLAALVPPPDGVLAHHDRLLAGAAGQIAARAAELAKLRDELDAVRLRERQLRAASPVVAAQDLDAARAERDALWQALRPAVLGGPRPPDAADLADALDRATATADALADRRYATAQDSASLLLVQQQAEMLALRIAQADAHLTRERHERDAAQQDWYAVCDAAAVPRLDVAMLRDWLVRRQAALDHAQRRRTAQDDLAELDARMAQAASTLAAALAQAATDVPLPALMQAAEQRLATARLAAEALRTARDRLAQARTAQDAAQRDVARLQAEETAWSEAWRMALAEAGLDGATSPDIVRRQLEIMDALRSQAATRDERSHRIARMEEDNAAFAAAVAACAERCGERTDGDPLAVLALLDRRLAEAREAAAELARIAVQRDRLALQAGEAKDMAMEAERLRAPLLQAAGTADPAELLRLVAAAEERRALRERCTACESSVIAAGDGLGLEVLLAAHAESEPDALAQAQRACQDVLDQVGRDLEAALAEQLEAARALDEVERGDAAGLAADQAQAAAAVEREAEDFARKWAQILLLRRVVAEHRRTRQGPLLDRASALFADLTDRAYGGLAVDQDSDRPRLLGLRPDGRAVEIEGMSDGTQDQIYLALRLASVEQAVQAGTVLPFLADDLLINFDDRRAAAALRALAGLARRTQVLFFTHHRHLVDLAQATLGPDAASLVDLDRSAA